MSRVPCAVLQDGRKLRGVHLPRGGVDSLPVMSTGPKKMEITDMGNPQNL